MSPYARKTVLLAPAAIERMNRHRGGGAWWLRVANGLRINTGFGKLASVRIFGGAGTQLQGEPGCARTLAGWAALSEAETRAMMLLRANAIAKGLSGVRPRIVETLARC